ncbi:DUF1131 family protein [Salmonella enterica subsp. enterica serovar Weltevreden]|nr:DUF1131 family protein [Salmonella enterica subsp. enterica serovar Weltevreden]
MKSLRLTLLRIQPLALTGCSTLSFGQLVCRANPWNWFCSFDRSHWSKAWSEATAATPLEELAIAEALMAIIARVAVRKPITATWCAFRSHKARQRRDGDQRRAGHREVLMRWTATSQPPRGKMVMPFSDLYSKAFGHREPVSSDSHTQRRM